MSRRELHSGKPPRQLLNTQDLRADVDLRSEGGGGKIKRLWPFGYRGSVSGNVLDHLGGAGGISFTLFFSDVVVGRFIPCMSAKSARENAQDVH